MPAARPVDPGRARVLAPQLTAPLLALLLTVLLTLVLTLAGALPASAHDQLIETTPATGSVVATAPATVSLRFRDDVLNLSSQLIVRGPAGDVVLDVPGVVEATTLSAPLPPDLADGTYQVAWRVVAGDGHPLQGAFEFSIGAASGPLPAAVVPSESSPTDSPSAAAVAVSDDGGGASGGTLALSVGGGLAALVAVTAVLLRRRRPTTAAS
ncbi:copper resistance protein CopC [Pengzhenrongella phosphoraccumulans]|uniref:copper resistance CopC family protein n=1 Tax=Pengzhenrongella phosphoraccumulans TaxID=3114394 RepID=UPI003890513B